MNAISPLYNSTLKLKLSRFAKVRRTDWIPNPMKPKDVTDQVLSWEEALQKKSILAIDCVARPFTAGERDRFGMELQVMSVMLLSTPAGDVDTLFAVNHEELEDDMSFNNNGLQDLSN